MALYDNRTLDVINELESPRRKNIRFALGYNLQGKTVSMCPGIDKKSVTSARVSQQCMDNQQFTIKKLLPELQKLPHHDARITTVEKTTNEILRSVKEVVSEIAGLAQNVAVMCEKHDNSNEQIARIEKSQNEMGKALRDRIKESEERQHKTDLTVNTLKANQNSILSVVVKGSPLAISLCALLWAVFSK